MESSKAQPLEKYLKEYSENYRHPVNILIHWISVVLIAFSLLGLVWAIPVPYIGFFGKLNGYLNLATFLILFATIYYLRLSFKIGLAMILTIWSFSAGIISLERMARLHSWPEMWQACLGIFVFAWVGKLIGNKIEGKNVIGLVNLQFILMGPALLWVKNF